jgi:DNA-binding transcriptional regulator YdaS (Cro superfamily)
MKLSPDSVKIASKRAVGQAVEFAGSQSALGRLIGRTQSTVRSWAVGRTLISPEFCADIEAATRGAVRKEQLRPDVYGNGRG